MIFKDTAWLYHKNGYSVIPVQGKIPNLFTEFQKYCKEQPDNKTMESWIKMFPDMNIGLATGEASRSVVVDMDYRLDTEYGRYLAQFFKDIIPYSRIEKIGLKGSSRFFLLNGETTRKFNLGDGNYLEILADGRQTVLPPSIHPDTQRPYVWVNEPLHATNVEDLPTLPNDFVKRIEEKIAQLNLEGNTEASTKDRAGRNDYLVDACFAKFHEEKDFDAVVDEIIKEDIRAHEVPLFSDLKEKQNRQKTTYENAVRFVKSNYKTFKKVYPNKDYFSEKFEKKVKDENRNISSLKIIGFGEFLSLDLPPPEWLIDRMIPIPGVAVIAAKPKVGKSNLVRGMMIACSRGTDFLDRKTKPVKVVYVALEGGESQLQQSFKLLGGVKTDNIALHHGPILKPDIKRIFEQVKALKPGLLIIDTLFKLIKVKNINDYGEVVDALTIVEDFAKENNLCIIGLHHEKKGDNTSDDGILGSTGITGAVDAIIRITKDENDTRYIQTTQRNEDNLPTTELIFDPLTGNVSLGKSIKDKKQNSKEDVLLRIIVSSPGITATELRSSSGMSRDNLTFALDRLIRKHAILRSGLGTKGSPHAFVINPHFHRT